MKKPRSILLALFTLLLVLVLCACSSKTTAFSFDGASFDISESNDNSLTANLKKVKNNYTLTIKGSGNSKDYESTSKLPWNVVSKMIDEVKIENGITKIGKNLFSSLSLKRFFIPESVESIEENAFKDNVTIYSYSLNAVNSSKAIMYLYSETKPVESGRYFRMVGEEPVVWQTNKILFIGNSFTFYPTGLETPAVPLIFKSVAEDLGVDVIVDYVLKGAHTLTGFANENDEMGMIVDEKLKASNDYDYVVLQEQSVAPIDSYNNFFSAVTKLKEKINKTQDHAKIYLYATWGFPSKITGSGIIKAFQLWKKL